MGGELEGRKNFTLGEVGDGGRVLLYDDMEGFCKWGDVDRLPRGQPRRVSSAAYEGDYGMGILARQTVPNGWAWGYAGRAVGLRGHKRTRAWVVFRGGWFPAAAGSRLQLRYYDGSKRWVAQVEYDFVGAETGWHQVVMEVDFENGVYGPCWRDGEDLGYEGLAVSSSVNAGAERLYVVVGVGSDLTVFEKLGFDCVLVEEA